MARKSGQSIPYNTQAVAKVATTKHEKQTDYVIEGVPGLVLTCFPSGKAGFAVRFTVKGARRREAIGQWGSTSGVGQLTLAEAKAKALQVAAGTHLDEDVLASDAAEEAKLTLQQLWDKRVALDEDRAAKTMHEYGRALKADVFPTLGSRKASEITSEEFADILAEVEDRTKHGARHCKAALSSLYRWGQKRRLVKINPLVVLGFNHQAKVRKRNVTDQELARLWRAIDKAPGVTAPIRYIVKIAILTGQRNTEVAGMEVGELKGLDTLTPRWDIPSRRMKRKSEDQYVPLSKQAADIARAALVGANGAHVFEGSTKGRVGGKWRQGHIRNASVSRAMGKVAEHAGLVDVHLHDMRKVITSWLAEHGHATGEVLDAILHHGKKGVTGTHYNFALYEKQVRQALQVWADHVWQITGQSVGGAGNVTSLAEAKAAARA